MNKPNKNPKQQERDAIELTIVAQQYAKLLFPEAVGESMELAEDEIYDLFDDNPDDSEDEIMSDIRQAINATRKVGMAVTPDHVFLMFRRMVKKDMF